ncbi:hypothetical protein RHS02_00620, partial [Rhizoctonia solani]
MMSTAGPHKETSWPLNPLSTMSATSPHYRSPHPTSDAYGPPYDPHASHQALTNARGARPKETYSSPEYVYTNEVSTYRRPWWMLGFEKKMTPVLFVIFGGAILGFSLSRTPMLNFNRLLQMTTPGEGFWYEQAPFKANIIIHIFTSLRQCSFQVITCMMLIAYDYLRYLAASFFSVFLFLPITWKRWPKFHSIFGYILSLLLAISLVCGSVLGRRAQGGDLNMQSAVYMLGSASAYAVVMGCLEARRGAIDMHREYMLRAWFYNGAFVTTRVTALISAHIVTAINGYFSLWKCAEVGYVLKTREALIQAYPECGTSTALEKPKWTHVAVHASWNEGPLGRGSASRASFGMALWVAMFLHILGIELYLRYTQDESKKWLPQEWGVLPLLSTTMFSSQRISYKTPLFLWIISQVAGGTSGQQTNATCDKSFDWASNSKGQSPCLVAAYLQGQCNPSKQWNVSALPDGTQYLAPTNHEVTGCGCSSPVYSLMSACAACQGASYGTWGQWTANCPAGLINNGTFPFQVPADTAMPQWALKMIGPDSYFDSEAARGGGSGEHWTRISIKLVAYARDALPDSLSGATVFLIVLLPILLIGIAGIMAWVWWQRRKRRARSGSMAGKEPLLRSAGSRQTIISVDTTSDIQIHLTRKSMGSLHSQYEYDRQYTQPSPVPTTPESAGYSSHPSPAVSSPGAQYAYYPEPPGYQPNQQFLVPPSAATSLGFNPQYHSTAPPQPNPPLTGATAQTFASQIESAPGRRASEPVVVENDSGTFPRTPVEPQLRALPLDDMRRLLPPSVRANAPSNNLQ